MGVRDEDMVDLRKLRQREIAYTGARVDHDIVIEYHRSGPQLPSDPAAAAKYPQFHCYFVVKVKAPSQSLPGGQARR